jgi:hypothetical protein
MTTAEAVAVETRVGFVGTRRERSNERFTSLYDRPGRGVPAGHGGDHGAGEPPPGSLDERMADRASDDNVLGSERTTIDGRTAVRIDQLSTPGDGHQGGVRYVTWYIDLGGVELWATSAPATEPSFDESVAGLDAIVHGLRLSG